MTYIRTPDGQETKRSIYGISTSQVNPNYSSSDLSNVNYGAKENNYKFQKPGPLGISHAFSPFQMPPTPPFSNSSTPVKETDPFVFVDQNTRQKWYFKWLPPMDPKIVVLCLCWYFCSIISNNSTKSILREFRYPITLAQCQFVLNSAFCVTLFACLLYLKNIGGQGQVNKYFPVGSIPNIHEVTTLRTFVAPTPLIISTTLSMGIFQFVGHITSHKATSIIPVSMVHTIKALSPLTTVLINRFAFSTKYKIVTYLSMIPLIFGIMLSCYNPKHLKNEQLYYKTGIAYAFISMLIFVIQNISAKKCLTFTEKPSSLPVSKDRDTKKLDKLTILLFCSIIGFTFTLPFYLYSECVNPHLSITELTSYTLSLIILNGLSHFLQSLLAFQILGSISPINYSIANIMKKIAIILVSFLWERQSISSNQSYGLVLTIIGLYCYDRWGTK
ncbi:DEHA2G05302p [Debaryomyces hansenii CBS767]|uniref:DEHA2G05302p n=1 Tax=Debaryomyces hansenii (strain ATCC 36239 / CBS 767 / BCRC 21394 / JCM 1990 / NBRC 0083 / IGC 2968) TaxID=284592 RepID=B5RV37_DEBHA|nr:DEHA2G05302p [Debaryomyces hansenii CBS767]CAR65916.1 DEHA2G05302p [Debaryomyces hansenii CBS767]|eukprot:XP_002770581.1 DEHA2G05302p [Debaryomyces hansenii CBS767]